VEQAIKDEVESLKSNIALDSTKLLRQVEAERQKRLGTIDVAIGTLQHELSSNEDVKAVIDRTLQSKDDAKVLHSYRALHSSAQDLITQFRLRKPVCRHNNFRSLKLCMNETLYLHSWTFKFHKVCAATEFRRGGRFYFTIFRSLPANPKVKELLKSVHICERYRKNKSDTF